jgi:hypothetical protein
VPDRIRTACPKAGTGRPEPSSDRSASRVAAGPQGTRLLTFEAPAVVVELQVVPAGSARQLEGHVDGAGGWELSREHAGGVLPVTSDEHGRFRVDAVPRPDAPVPARRCARRHHHVGDRLT